MAWKSKTGSERPRRPKRLTKILTDAQRAARRRRRLIAFVVLVLAAVLVGGFWAMEQWVLRRQVGDAPQIIGVRIVDRPEWMPDSLAGRIAADILPADSRYHDEALARRVYELAVANPWIAAVEPVLKRRTADGRQAYVELTARFRQPIARAGRDGKFFYVDAEGVRLPDSSDEPQVPKYVLAASADGQQPAKRVFLVDRAQLPPGAACKKLHYIIIDGVASKPPEPGRAWAGRDVADGLELVKLLLNRSYADQITVVDMANHGGRISTGVSEITIYAQIGRGRPTEIRFGRFPTGQGDWVVTPEQKLANLDAYVLANNGRLAGVNEYLDLRYDEMHVSIN